MKGVIVLAALVCVDCGFSEETPLQASGHIQHAVVNTYGWSTLDLAQDIEVALARDVAVADVFDMSVFGRLTPGFTQDDALRLVGSPDRVWTDDWGEPWHVYERPNASVEVGCQYYSSGGAPSACSWKLRAIPKDDPTTLLLDSQLLGYLRQGVAAHPSVSIRSLAITTADRQQTVQLYVRSRIGPGVYWTDQRHLVGRKGEPKAARRPKRG